MNRNEMIEKAAKALANHMYGYDAWDEHVTREGVRDVYRCQARVALESAGVALPPEPLAVGTRKRSPGGAEVALTRDEDNAPWLCYRRGEGYQWDTGDWLSHSDVADWEVIDDTPSIPEGHVTIDMSGYTDWLIDAWTARMDSLGDAARAEQDRRGES